MLCRYVCSVYISGGTYVLMLCRYVMSCTTINIYIIPVIVIFLPKNFNTRYIVTDSIITTLW